MPTKNIYISDEDAPYWDRVMEIAKRRKTSISKVIAAELRNLVRDEQQRSAMGLPLGVPVPAAMKDPKVLRREQAADDLRVAILQKMEELESES